MRAKAIGVAGELASRVENREGVKVTV